MATDLDKRFAHAEEGLNPSTKAGHKHLPIVVNPSTKAGHKHLPIVALRWTPLPVEARPTHYSPKR
jgi:hypothetical protein